MIFIEIAYDFHGNHPCFFAEIAHDFLQKLSVFFLQ